MKFLRRTWSRYSKLGRGRKKLQKWRRPTGRDNKMREKRKGYPARVSVGYKTIRTEKPIVVMNISELESVKDKKIIIGKIGKKKRLEIANKAKKMKLQIMNLNVEKLLKNSERLNKLGKEKGKWI